MVEVGGGRGPVGGLGLRVEDVVGGCPGHVVQAGFTHVRHVEMDNLFNSLYELTR